MKHYSVMLQEAVDGTIKYRPFNQPIYDSTQSNLSKIPSEWKNGSGGDEK